MGFVIVVVVAAVVAFILLDVDVAQLEFYRPGGVVAGHLGRDVHVTSVSDKS